MRLWRAPGAEDGAHAAAAYGAEEVAVLEVGSGLSSDVRVSACEQGAVSGWPEEGSQPN